MSVISLGWQSAFLATTVILGDTLEDAQASLLERDAELGLRGLPGLAHAQRDVRARALAGALGQIMGEVERVRVT